MKRNQVTRNCEICGRQVTRCASQMRKHVFCSRGCATQFLSRRMSAMNKDLNPNRMTFSTRTKLREYHLSLKAHSYAKYFGRHEHRVVAEQILGRKLKPGEVVHHIDGNKRNNDALNLMVFPNQAAHALWHKNELLDPAKNYE